MIWGRKRTTAKAEPEPPPTPPRALHEEPQDINTDPIPETPASLFEPPVEEWQLLDGWHMPGVTDSRESETRREAFERYVDRYQKDRPHLETVERAEESSKAAPTRSHGRGSYGPLSREEVEWEMRPWELVDSDFEPEEDLEPEEKEENDDETPLLRAKVGESAARKQPSSSDSSDSSSLGGRKDPLPVYDNPGRSSQASMSKGKEPLRPEAGPSRPTTQAHDRFLAYDEPESSPQPHKGKGKAPIRPEPGSSRHPQPTRPSLRPASPSSDITPAEFIPLQEHLANLIEQIRGMRAELDNTEARALGLVEDRFSAMDRMTSHYVTLLDQRVHTLERQVGELRRERIRERGVVGGAWHTAGEKGEVVAGPSRPPRAPWMQGPVLERPVGSVQEVGLATVSPPAQRQASSPQRSPREQKFSVLRQTLITEHFSTQTRALVPYVDYPWRSLQQQVEERQPSASLAQSGERRSPDIPPQHSQTRETSPPHIISPAPHTTSRPTPTSAPLPVTHHRPGIIPLPTIRAGLSPGLFASRYRQAAVSPPAAVLLPAQRAVNSRFRSHHATTDSRSKKRNDRRHRQEVRRREEEARGGPEHDARAAAQSGERATAREEEPVVAGPSRTQGQVREPSSSPETPATPPSLSQGSVWQRERFPRNYNPPSPPSRPPLIPSPAQAAAVSVPPRQSQPRSPRQQPGAASDSDFTANLLHNLPPESTHPFGPTNRDALYSYIPPSSQPSPPAPLPLLPSEYRRELRITPAQAQAQEAHDRLSASLEEEEEEDDDNAHDISNDNTDSAAILHKDEIDTHHHLQQTSPHQFPNPKHPSLLSENPPRGRQHLQFLASPNPPCAGTHDSRRKSKAAGILHRGV